MPGTPETANTTASLCDTSPKVLPHEKMKWSSEAFRQTIPHHFERWAARDPERMAVSCAGIGLSYCELNRAANGIARSLLESGAAADRPVALLLEHGTMMIAAILGVLKTGRTCVFLDA